MNPPKPLQDYIEDRNRLITEMVERHVPAWLNLNRSSAKPLLKDLGYKLVHVLIEDSRIHNIIKITLMRGDVALESMVNCIELT